MKKILFSFFGAIIFGGVCVGLAWLMGYLFGPLYQGEDESTRNFKIFLGVFLASIISGGLTGYYVAKKTS